jgi:hypothetical protein
VSTTQVEHDLTERQRRLQLVVRARSLRDLAILWPIWKINDPASFHAFAVATIDLVRSYRQMSAAVSAAYYSAFRKAERAAGVATPSLVTAVTVEQVLASLNATGQAMNQPLEEGVSVEMLRQNAYVRVSGAISRHILNAGRDTILESVNADPHAIGWARVTDGDPCYFCLTLASRGAVYKNEETATFQAHDHCGCTAMPVFDGTEIPSLDKWRSIYDDAQHQGLDDGLLQHGENSSQARLNAVRRFLAPH